MFADIGAVHPNDAEMLPKGACKKNALVLGIQGRGCVAHPGSEVPPVIQMLAPAVVPCAVKLEAATLPYAFTAPLVLLVGGIAPLVMIVPTSKNMEPQSTVPIRPVASPLPVGTDVRYMLQLTAPGTATVLIVK